VFATMYIRDHARPEFHKALGINPSDYGMKVFRITSEISKQVFPVTLDIDNPKFKACLERLLMLHQRVADADEQGGVMGKLKRWGNTALAGATLVRLYFLPVIKDTLPAKSRLQPAY
jgi:magnesium-protoporphyrin IX monomethyl ester (oxidative) cyclase